MRFTLIGVLLGLYWLALALYALAWWLALAAPLLAAPAPRPKAKARPPIVGKWTLVQRGQRYDAEFFRDGVWACRSPGSPADCYWVGIWRLEGDRLTCTEQYHVGTEATNPESEWVAELEPGTLRGAERRAHWNWVEPFALERPAKLAPAPPAR